MTEARAENGGFPQLKRNDMDMIARALSYCLSDQYGEEIVFRFIPKEKKAEEVS